jgi:hypothetical protein
MLQIGRIDRRRFPREGRDTPRCGNEPQVPRGAGVLNSGVQIGTEARASRIGQFGVSVQYQCPVKS